MTAHKIYAGEIDSIRSPISREGRYYRGILHKMVLSAGDKTRNGLIHLRNPPLLIYSKLYSFFTRVIVMDWSLVENGRRQ